MKYPRLFPFALVTAASIMMTPVANAQTAPFSVASPDCDANETATPHTLFMYYNKTEDGMRGPDGRPIYKNHMTICTPAGKIIRVTTVSARKLEGAGKLVAVIGEDNEVMGTSETAPACTSLNVFARMSSKDSPELKHGELMAIFASTSFAPDAPTLT
jgi:hypothetical protein